MASDFARNETFLSNYIYFYSINYVIIKLNHLDQIFIEN